MIKVEFLDESGQPISTTKLRLNVDLSSIIYGSEMGKGEADASISVFCETPTSRPVEIFTNMVKKVLIFYSADCVWAGKATNTTERPQFQQGQFRLIVRFTGYYTLLSQRRIAKIHVDKLALSELVSPSDADLQARGIKSRQGEGQRSEDGGQIETVMVQNNVIINHATQRFVLQYQALNGNFIEAIKGGVLGFRSGEGLQVDFVNYLYGVIFKHIDVLDTSDQTTLQNKTLLYTPVTGGNTDIIEYVMGTSVTLANGQVFNYGSGVIENTDTLLSTDNCIILLFNKSFTKDITAVRVLLNSDTEARAKAAVYDAIGNLSFVFDNEVVLSSTPAPIEYTFFKNGGFLDNNVGTYYLVIRVDNQAANVDITTVGNTTSGGGFVVGGHRWDGTLGGVYPAFSGTFTQNTPHINTYTKLEFLIDTITPNEYDENDKLMFSQLTVFMKYHPLHQNYLNPTYTGKEIIRDILLTSIPEIVYNDALIPSGINGDLPFNQAGDRSAVLVGDALKAIYDVYDGGQLWPQVWAYNNGGVPQLELRLRDDTVENPIYGVDTNSDNCKLEINNAVKVINYVSVKFKDEAGRTRIISPATHPELLGQGGDGLDRVDYLYEAGEATEAEALQAGKMIIAEYGMARESGKVTITGPNVITNYPSRSLIPLAKVHAMDKMVLIGHTTSEGDPNPPVQIRKANYTVGNGQLVLEFGNPDFNQDILSRLKKQILSNQ